MKKRLSLLLFASLAGLLACTHKELSDIDGCHEGNTSVKVVENWEFPSKARAMRINIFSLTEGVVHYGRDNVPASGVKYINLYNRASYRPITYDYEAANIYFRDENIPESFQAYFAGSTRATYEKYAYVPTKSEKTVTSPTNSEFYAHAWELDEPFEVRYVEGVEQVLNFYPRNLLREFTYRVNNIKGVYNIKEARGVVTGMAATYSFHANAPVDERSTLLFENGQPDYDAQKDYGYIEGVFYTFGPVYPYENWFTLEIISNANRYYTASWDVSAQVGESMADRPAKLARDGYDILIWNDDDIPEIPDPEGGTGGGSGFQIGVGEWDDVWVEL